MLKENDEKEIRRTLLSPKQQQFARTHHVERVSSCPHTANRVKNITWRQVGCFVPCDETGNNPVGQVNFGKISKFQQNDLWLIVPDLQSLALRMEPRLVPMAHCLRCSRQKLLGWR